MAAASYFRYVLSIEHEIFDDSELDDGVERAGCLAFGQVWNTALSPALSDKV